MALFTNLFAYQPFKALFVLGSLVLNVSRLPLWLLKYAFVRQHPSWTYRKALSLRLLRAFVYASARVRVNTPLPLTRGEEGDQFVVLTPRPGDASKYKGPMLAAASTVQPAPIGAIWYPAPLTAVTDETLVILHIHGGAYVIGTGRADYSGFLATTLATTTPATHVLAPSYRLSTLPPSPTSNPFPAALQDALTAYLYLLHECHVPASRIILSGDSAGANCAIALLRYMAHFGPELDLPPPSAALLWSPWIDPTHAAAVEASNPHNASDYIPDAFLIWGVSALAGQTIASVSAGRTRLAGDAYVNAKLEPFRTETPLWVSVGDAEVLFFDGVEWAEGMRGKGNRVEVDVMKGACHDVLLVGNMLGVEAEAEEMGRRAGKWVEGARK